MMWTTLGRFSYHTPARFGGKSRQTDKEERKPQCPSLPPTRPESPTASTNKEALGSLLRKKEHWADEVYKHRDCAEQHVLNYLTTSDENEEILSQRHLQYADKCENWHDQVIAVLRKKLNLPAVSSPLNPACSSGRQE